MNAHLCPAIGFRAIGLTRRAYVLGGAGAAGAALAACVPGRAPGAPTSAKQLSGTVQVLDFELSSPAAKERWDKTVARFRERFPGITLIEDRSRNDSQWEKLPAAVAAGTPPDTAPLRRIQDFPSMVGRGALLPLDTHLANSRVVKRADFYDRVLAIHTHEGKLYALPSSIAIYLWYFNKSLFQAAGLKTPDLTWDYNDLDDAAAKLTRKSGDDFVQAGLQIPTWWPNHHMGNRDVAPWQGGILEKGTCARANYDRPEVVDAYEWFQKHICRQRTAEPDSATSRTAFGGVTWPCC